MILARPVRAVRDSKNLLRAAQARLQGVWRDPLAHRVIEEYWVPLVLDAEQLEANLIATDTAITSQLDQLRDLARPTTA